MNDPDAAYVTFRTRFNFERAWPPLDREWLATLAEQIARWRAEQEEKEREGKL